jgi:hypothetical protein
MLAVGSASACCRELDLFGKKIHGQEDYANDGFPIFLPQNLPAKP